MNNGKLSAHDFMMYPLRPGGPTVAEAVERLRHQVAHKEFSDVIDDAGYQYVDLVLQGGGILGIALVGYIYVLEQAGLRFLSLAGSSAGAINTLLIAALGPPVAAKSEAMLKHLANLDAREFLDGRFFARGASLALARGAGKLSVVSQLSLALPGLLKHYGLHPGKRFLGWVDEILRSENVDTAAKLRARMGTCPPGLRARTGREERSFECRIPGRLAIVTVDVVTKTKFVFPEMSALIFDDPDEVSPSTFVRASMSIPWFFHPSRTRGRRDEAQRALWVELAGYQGELPDHHLFVDGGIVSNFPINIFHRPDVVPFAPTLGVRLGIERHATNTSSFSRFTKATVDAARQALDFDFLFRNPDYQHLIGTVETEGFNWLNFELGPQEKLGLFARGVEAAVEFLTSFDWGKYKEVRFSLAEADRRSRGI
ncbi:putative esterase of the alpha-beta hydrolase superfamily [Singulisphaera acidiphila DSM 18658]|uniref:Putative esterase of the alpha-beta hydrolase superfamily n=2 Tax=Singulisphaera acidiphila TaxID=466153 RepID=L0D7K5_SINAD|nr:putative esterase of the alpha-beta hydrolase superfamily [Singulisphaera acidiphila DSM 18658]